MIKDAVDEIDDKEEVVEVVEEAQEPEDRGDALTPVKEEAEEVEEPVEKKAEKEEEVEEVEEEERERMIPRARFDEVNNKFKQLQEEISRLKESQPAPAEIKPAETSVEEMEVKAANALMEGDVEGYVKIQRQIREMVMAEAEVRAEAKIEQRENAKSLAETVKDLVSKHPELDAQTGDKTIINEVVEWRDFFVTQKGLSVPEALRAAVKRVMSEAAPEKEPVLAKEDARPAVARERAAAASRAQPPALNVVGMGNRVTAAKVNPEELSEEEFEQLPIAEKRKMRGD